MLIPRLSFGKLVHISSSLMTLLLAMNMHALAEHFRDDGAESGGQSLVGQAMAEGASGVAKAAAGPDKPAVATNDGQNTEATRNAAEGWTPLTPQGGDDAYDTPSSPPSATADAAQTPATAPPQAEAQDCPNNISCAGMKPGTTTVAADPATRKAETSLVKDILARQVTLSTQEKALGEQKRVLDAAKLALEEKMRNLDATLALLAEKQAAHRETVSAETDRLVKIYEEMPAKEAAAVFNIMDIHVLVSIVSKMTPRKVSAVMGVMIPERVNLISQYLAGVRTFRPPHGGDDDTSSRTEQTADGGDSASWWLKPQPLQPTNRSQPLKPSRQ